jgi:hypothetical protein
MRPHRISIVARMPASVCVFVDMTSSNRPTRTGRNHHSTAAGLELDAAHRSVDLRQRLAVSADGDDLARVDGIGEALRPEVVRVGRRVLQAQQ